MNIEETKWRSVDNEKPEPLNEIRIHYQVTYKNGGPKNNHISYRTALVIYTQGRWIGKNGVEPWDEWENCIINVLHWHPVPKEPKINNQGDLV